MKNSLKWAALLSTVLFSAVSCSDNDDKTPPDPAIEAVKGTYAGTMTFAPIDVPVAPIAAEEPAGEALEFSVTDKVIKFDAFPIAGLVEAILGQANDDLIAAIGKVKYEIPFTAKFNAAKDGVAITMTPQPLKLSVKLGDAPVMNITVGVEVSQDGEYMSSDKSLQLTINATSVTIGESPMDEFSPLALTFEMTKK